MGLNFYKKYKQNKEEPDELKDLKKSFKTNQNTTFLDKLIESEEIDKLILKVQGVYNKISEKLFIKYDLKNELKQGKIFTILIAILIFLFLIVLTVFFTIMLNSLLGLNLIFSVLKYSLFLLKWGYTILKNKGTVMKKYLANLFPNSKLLNKKKELKIEGLPIFETTVLKEVDNLLLLLENVNPVFSNERKEIITKLKEVVDMLKLDDEEYIREFKSLEQKQDIFNKLSDVREYIIKVTKKQEEERKFSETKMQFYERFDYELMEKPFQKKIGR